MKRLIRPAALTRWQPVTATQGQKFAAGIAAVAAVLLAGCSGEAATAPIPTSAAATTSSSSVATPTPEAISTTAAPVTDVVTVDAFGLPSADGAFFATPSGNIGCAAFETDVRCDVLDNTWSVPPTPSDCEFDFGLSVALVGTGKSELGCISDSVMTTDSAVLGYGEAVEFGSTTCVSRRSGLRCQNTSTGHGFTVSRASYTLF